ncbi:MAG: hypothetical protein K8F25_15010 [Fimbriimonadaceae bacterium]|nr:hypothetical protein [Alphaproteobacteria bacterium]
MKRVSDRDQSLLRAIQDGLPLVERPYQAVGQQIGMSEGDVIAALQKLIERGVIKRFGLIVRHHELGYNANAMVVWNVDDSEVDEVAARIIGHDFITLCYRRPRRLPDWPYNLFCMIHGRDRDTVMAQINQMTLAAGLQHIDREVLFSRRRFKQRGAWFGAKSAGAA